MCVHKIWSGSRDYLLPSPLHLCGNFAWLTWLCKTKSFIECVRLVYKMHVYVISWQFINYQFYMVSHTDTPVLLWFNNTYEQACIQFVSFIPALIHLTPPLKCVGVLLTVHNPWWQHFHQIQICISGYNSPCCTSFHVWCTYNLPTSIRLLKISMHAFWLRCEIDVYCSVSFTLQALGAPLRSLVPGPLPVKGSLSQRWISFVLCCLEEDRETE